MGLLDDVVAVVHSVTNSLGFQTLVTFERCTSATGYGEKLYDEGPVQLRAVVDWRQTQVRSSDGTMEMAAATITFLDTPALLAATAGLGVRQYDKITMPDGRTGPILARSGFVASESTVPVATEVSLG